MKNVWFDIKPPYADYDKARVVIIPAPYEGTVSWKKGTKRAPQVIRDASRYIESYDSILDLDVFKLGISSRDFLVMPYDPQQASQVVRAAVGDVLKAGQRPVMVGGEHSLSLGAVSACSERFPDLAVLQLDAHADLREEYDGSRFSHACVMRRVAELGVNFVQAGVRSMSRPEKDWLESQGRRVTSSRHILQNSDWTHGIIEALSDNIYITLDLDVLDPSEMPATGTPEPGGISYHHLVELTLAIRKAGKTVIGMDMVELSPIQGMNHPEFLAASLLYTMIGAFWWPEGS